MQQEIGERSWAQGELARTVEELKRSNDDLEQFACSASHDLQEPLRMISVYGQMLQKKCGGKLGEGDEYIRHIVTGATHMQQLLADLRAFMQASTTGDEAIDDVNANGALHRALKTLMPAMESSGTSVICGPLPWVRWHEFQLAQLFQNLIGNAIRYRSRQAPRIEVAAEACGDQWKFSVRDNGVGIDPSYHQQIFGMFKRLQN